MVFVINIYLLGYGKKYLLMFFSLTPKSLWYLRWGQHNINVKYLLYVCLIQV